MVIGGEVTPFLVKDGQDVLAYVNLVVDLVLFGVLLNVVSLVE